VGIAVRALWAPAGFSVGVKLQMVLTHESLGVDVVQLSFHQTDGVSSIGAQAAQHLVMAGVVRHVNDNDKPLSRRSASPRNRHARRCFKHASAGAALRSSAWYL